MLASMGTRRHKKQEPESQDSARVRIIFDSTEILRQAIHLRASKEAVRQRRKVPAHEVLNELLRACLERELRELSDGG